MNSLEQIVKLVTNYSELVGDREYLRDVDLTWGTYSTMLGRTMMPLIALLVFGASFIFALGSENEACAMARESARWPVTTGHITLSQIGTSYSTTRYGVSSTVYPRVRYRYEVAGTTYDTGGIAYNPTIDQSSTRKLDYYYVGREVPVHYCPTNPRSACLEIGETKPSRGLLFGFGWFFCFPVAAIAAYKLMRYGLRAHAMRLELQRQQSEGSS